MFGSFKNPFGKTTSAPPKERSLDSTPKESSEKPSSSILDSLGIGNREWYISPSEQGRRFQENLRDHLLGTPGEVLMGHKTLEEHLADEAKKSAYREMLERKARMAELLGGHPEYKNPEDGQEMDRSLTWRDFHDRAYNLLKEHPESVTAPAAMEAYELLEQANAMLKDVYDAQMGTRPHQDLADRIIAWWRDYHKRQTL